MVMPAVAFYAEVNSMGAPKIAESANAKSTANQKGLDACELVAAPVVAGGFDGGDGAV